MLCQPARPTHPRTATTAAGGDRTALWPLHPLLINQQSLLAILVSHWHLASDPKCGAGSTPCCHPLPSPRVKQSPSLTFLEGTLTFEETASRPALLLQAASCSTFSASSTCCTTCTAHHTNRQKMSKEEFLSEDSDLVMSSL